MAAVNACSDGPVDAVALCELIAERLGTTPRYRRAGETDRSPFSFDRWYPMDNRRAAGLGLRFSPTAQWLDGAVGEVLGALGGLGEFGGLGDRGDSYAPEERHGRDGHGAGVSGGRAA
ncbi:hypothetical protein ACFVYP_23680 [Kitasatospora sp. NPDC058201]|uniref:hypothetical protein n=1 Tax=unclassified Kitasatospora TaxID=2633591 RepID=UPI0036690488